MENKVEKWEMDKIHWIGPFNRSRSEGAQSTPSSATFMASLSHFKVIYRFAMPLLPLGRDILKSNAGRRGAHARLPLPLCCRASTDCLPFLVPRRQWEAELLLQCSWQWPRSLAHSQPEQPNCGTGPEHLHTVGVVFDGEFLYSWLVHNLNCLW